MTPNDLAEEIQSLRRMLHRTIVGYDDVIDDLVLALVARGHVLLEGVPGVAKTTLAKSFALATGLGFKRVQFTPDLLPADITGHEFYDQSAGTFQVRRGPIFTNVLLADEINRAPPKTQSALLEAMEERQVTIEGESYPLPQPFMVVATLNPVDVEGVYRLPEAQLDRFFVRSNLDYLPTELERVMLRGKLDGSRDLDELGEAVEPAVGEGFVERARERLRKVRVDDGVLAYLHQVGLATREDPRVSLGASPRALEVLLRATRARALLEGRDHALPDDVKHVAPRVLDHRLILDVEAELDDVTARAVLQDILDTVPVPK